MGAGLILHVEPPVVPIGELGREIVVRDVVPAAPDGISLACDIFGDERRLVLALCVVLHLGGVAAVVELVPDLHHLALRIRTGQGVENGIDVVELFLSQGELFGQMHLCRLGFVVFFIIELCVLRRRQPFIKRDLHLRAVLRPVIRQAHRFHPALHPVDVRRDEIPPELVFFSLGTVRELLPLERHLFGDPGLSVREKVEHIGSTLVQSFLSAPFLEIRVDQLPKRCHRHERHGRRILGQRQKAVFHRHTRLRSDEGRLRFS